MFVFREFILGGNKKERIHFDHCKKDYSHFNSEMFDVRGWDL